MDYEGAVNAVLKRMRVPTITAVTDNAYSTLIGEFVNQAKREVEDAWNWSVLRTQVAVATVASTATYSLTGTNHRSRVEFVHNTTNKGTLIHVTKEFMERQQNFTDNQELQPAWWRTNVVPNTDTLQLELHPIPDAVYQLTVYVVIPDDDFTSDTQVIQVPYYPVVLGAYVLALSERGDEGSTSEQRAQADYQSALSDAIAQDSWRQTNGMESDWTIT